MSSAQRQIKQTSIQKNVETFLKDLTDLECFQLCMYLGGRFMNEAPNSIQSRFVEEFFDAFEWSKYIAVERLSITGKEPLFYRPNFDLEGVRVTVMYVTLQRMPELIADKAKAVVKVSKLELKEIGLKVKIAKAIDDAYEDKVFDKIEGFCNLTDVLVEAKLLTLPKDED